MSSSITLRGVQLLPLWRRRIPKYPVYWKGDPQLRVFMPHFWMRMVKPENKVPLNHVHFEVHPQMSQVDVKNYLEKIYKVPVMHVRTMIERGEEKKQLVGGKRSYVKVREDDKKFAFVVMDEKVEFEFPDIFEGKKPDLVKQLDVLEETKRAEMVEEQKTWDRAMVPPWFR